MIGAKIINIKEDRMELDQELVQDLTNAYFLLKTAIRDMDQDLSFLPKGYRERLKKENKMELKKIKVQKIKGGYVFIRDGKFQKVSEKHFSEIKAKFNF